MQRRFTDNLDSTEWWQRPSGSFDRRMVPGAFSCLPVLFFLLVQPCYTLLYVCFFPQLYDIINKQKKLDDVVSVGGMVGNKCISFIRNNVWNVFRFCNLGFLMFTLSTTFAKTRAGVIRYILSGQYEEASGAFWGSWAHIPTIIAVLWNYASTTAGLICCYIIAV
jgi:p-aminobenzoyl-glutamate transporter AbgT